MNQSKIELICGLLDEQTENQCTELNALRESQAAEIRRRIAELWEQEQAA